MFRFLAKLGLRLLGLGGGLFGLLGDGIHWLFERPVRLLIVGLLVSNAIALHTIRTRTDQRDKAIDHAAAEKKARLDTVAAVKRAAEEAQRRRHWQNRQTAQKQAAITKETVNGYEARIAAIRARAERLRQQLDAAPVRPGSAGKDDLPSTGHATGRADEASRDHGFSATGEACAAGMTLGERLIATLQAHQLDTLITWNLEQARVDVNAAPEAEQ